MKIRERIDKLFRDHGEQLFRYLRTFRLSEAETYDLVQNVFMKLIEGQAEKVKQPKAWLFTVGRNMAINVMKKNKKMGREDELSSISREPDALTVLLEEEKYDRLWKAFAHLDTEEKEIYRLYLEHGFSHKEIAKIIEKSEGATKVMMHRTREKLRNYLNKEFENGIGHQSSNGE